MDRDRELGMYWGVFLGDALGAPFEHVGMEGKYRGLIEYPLIQRSRYQGKRVGNIGQVTDDSEMMIALYNSLASEGRYRGARPLKGGYDREETILSYLDWANSGCPFMGNNIRSLLHGVKTVKGYENRMKKKTEEEDLNSLQSNGCLMRCAPLATLRGKKRRANAVTLDCSITNPNETCIQAVGYYIETLHNILRGNDAKLLDRLTAPSNKDVREALEDAKRHRRRDVKSRPTKGWVCHNLYTAFLSLNSDASFEDRIDEVIRLGGDTDTNGAVAGAIIGAQVGFEKMMEEERTGSNLRLLFQVKGNDGNIPRPPKYCPGECFMRP